MGGARGDRENEAGRNDEAVSDEATSTERQVLGDRREGGKGESERDGKR